MVDSYYYLDLDMVIMLVIYLSVAVVKALRMEYLGDLTDQGEPYHLPTVLADTDSPMLLVVPAGVVGADLVVLYNNYRPLWAGHNSVAANMDSPMLSAERELMVDVDLVVLIDTNLPESSNCRQFS